MDSIAFLIFKLLVLIFSVMMHEVAHGAVAYKLGDNTAKAAGRLNLNPLRHLDLMGSVFVPLLTFFASRGSLLFGWAKPVPYNPSNLKNPRKGAALIAAAGPLTNIAIAVIFGIVIRIAAPFLVSGANETGAIFILLLNIIVSINVVLGVLNLLPIPPLDGSKILFAILPASYYKIALTLERYGFLFLLLFIFFGFQIIIPISVFLYRLIVGQWGII